MLAKRELCCGCGVCAAVCAHHAISMQYDQEGFLYPEIDRGKCVSCGLCTAKCPVLGDQTPPPSQNIAVYCGHYADEEKTKACSSGGFVTALAEKVLSEEGVVFGVCYDEALTRAEYRKAETAAQLGPMRGSKYVMSELRPEILHEVRNELKKGRKVLFTGCPCEVGAVKKFLGGEKENLITCDLICQGGTTPIALRQYLGEMQRKLDSRITNLNMRAKKDGRWLPGHMKLFMENGAEYLTPLGTTDFDASFQHVKRPSCYRCRFKHPFSAADFTAGDHIGINAGDIGYHSSGVSVIFVHTEKGDALLRDFASFPLYPETFERAAGIQACLSDCIRESDYRQDFLRIMRSSGLAEAAEFVRRIRLKIFEERIRSAVPTDTKSKQFDCVIWGVGKYFEITYETIQRVLPDAHVAAIVDRYKTGERHGIKIIPPSKLDSVSFDHIFITTVGGREEAVTKLEALFGKGAANYTLAMLPSDETRE